MGHTILKQATNISISQMAIASDECVGEGREPIFRTAPEGSRLQIRKPWHWLMIFQRVEAVVEDNSWDHGVCWENLGGYMASNDRGACDLTETVGSPTSAADI